MTNVSITRGDQEQAEQFNEGADTYVRVSEIGTANLNVYSEDRYLLVVKVAGEEALRSIVEANQGYTFPCASLLKVKRSRSQLARDGFFALLGGQKPNREELVTEFVVEVRQPGAGASLDASYNFRLLTDEEFDTRFAGYMSARVTEEPKPIYTRDARPIECLANNTKCLACGTVITDCIAGCENGDCPTVLATALS